MELSEAIDVLKNKIGDYVIPDYCKDCQNKADCVDDCNFLLAIFTVTQALEELQVEKNQLLLVDLANEKKISNEENRRCMLLAIENNDLKEKLSNSISKDKIKEKIEELKEATQEALSECGSASKEFTICVYQEAVLEELLKGE